MRNYFSQGEIQCRCGCGGTWTEDFHNKMNIIREEVGGPMSISSGFRCIEYDKKIGGKGVHATGRAGDVLCSGRLAHKIMSAALRHGVKGIGVSQKGPHEDRFLHLDDTEGNTRPWIWSY